MVSLSPWTWCGTFRSPPSSLKLGYLVQSDEQSLEFDIYNGSGEFFGRLGRDHSRSCRFMMRGGNFGEVRYFVDGVFEDYAVLFTDMSCKAEVLPLLQAKICSTKQVLASKGLQGAHTDMKLTAATARHSQSEHTHADGLPWRWMLMVFFLLMIGGQVEPQDDIVNEQDYFDPEEDFKVDLVKEEREAEWMEDWPLCRGKASALMEEEVAKKVMAKQMKQVKREMVNAVMEGTSNLTSKIPTSMVKMVTLLLLQPVAFGGEGTDGQEEKNEQYTKAGGWEGYVMVIAYSLLVFAFGICCGYVYRLRVGIFLRTLARFVRQERIMELQREQDHQEALRDYRGYRGLVMRTMVNRDGEIPLPNVKTAILSKVIDYCKYHKDSPPEEIQKPLKSTNLVECGVSEWDNEYVNIEQEAMTSEQPPYHGCII
eukprot:g18065.t1